MTAISFSQLPYYMTPDRNLMTERGLKFEQQRVLVSFITEIIEEGPIILLRLNKIRQAVIGHPEQLLWYSKFRTELEMVHYKYDNRIIRCVDSNFMVDETDTIVQACDKRINEMLLEVLCHMRLEGSSVNDVNKVFEMMHIR
ncbi:hypothetical protein DPMN_037794 [Dreissena polymorpha]|uniref:Uncharacterized protein n=1 Tax=Dreissena polymorpha TaxID=45954 RepID=A0A9D4MD81_DREPO|nr:hypothetical protein DPMN_037794 [Dreissena polymorpha]